MKIVDARNNAPQYLKESSSQTAGPYVHIGLAPGAEGARIAWEAHAVGYVVGFLAIGPLGRMFGNGGAHHP